MFITTFSGDTFCTFARICFYFIILLIDGCELNPKRENNIDWVFCLLVQTKTPLSVLPVDLPSVFPCDSGMRSSPHWCTCTCSAHGWQWRWRWRQLCRSPWRRNSGDRPQRRSAHPSDFHSTCQNGHHCNFMDGRSWVTLGDTNLCMCFVLPGVVLKVMHVLIMFVHVRCHIVQLHLQVHNLKEKATSML